MDSRRHYLPICSLIAIAGGALTGCATTPERTDAEAEPVNLSGEWIINEQLSDRPSEVLGRVSNAGAAAGGLLKTMSYGVGIYGISVGQILDILPEGEEEPSPTYPREITDPMDELEVAQIPGSVAVDYDGITTMVYKNGEIGSDTEQVFAAEWQEDSFVVERQPRDGLAFSERFQLTSDRKQLVWVVSFETPEGKDLRITRIYDLKPDQASPVAGDAARFVARNY